MLQKLSITALFGILTLCLVACNKSETTADKGPEPDSTTQSGDMRASGIDSVNGVDGQGKGLVSPAKQGSKNGFTVDTDPETITSAYLGSLKKAMTENGSLKDANDLLTTNARKATQTANVDVSLPGTENAKYVVHQAKYVTNEKNVSHVLTTWSDSVDGESYEYDVTWVLKQEKNIGWRVSGMITDTESAGNSIVFNFEDSADIISKGGPDSTETQTANKTDADGNIR